MSSSVRFIASVLGLAAYASAHGVMSSPQPYGFGSGLTNGPMAQGTFPCKTNEVKIAPGTAGTTWNGGSTTPLMLQSGATHGGGSCFIAMTYEAPGSSAFNDPANWRNVYTIPGSCPATTAGNLNTVTNSPYPSGPQCASAGPDGTDCVHSYDIPMNDNMKDGAATFAWVWLSKVTTETYMNCAPVTISGSKNGNFDSLPSLQGLSMTGLTGGGVPGGSGSSSSSGSGSSPSGTGAAPASQSSSSSSSGSGAAPPPAAAAPSAAASAPAPAAAAPSVAASSPSAGSSSGSSSGGGACSPNGSMKCTSTDWQMCSNGQWVDMGSIGGLTCSNNQLNKRQPYKAFRG